MMILPSKPEGKESQAQEHMKIKQPLAELATTAHR